MILTVWAPGRRDRASVPSYIFIWTEHVRRRRAAVMAAVANDTTSVADSLSTSACVSGRWHLVSIQIYCLPHRALCSATRYRHAAHLALRTRSWKQTQQPRMIDEQQSAAVAMSP